MVSAEALPCRLEDDPRAGLDQLPLNLSAGHGWRVTDFESTAHRANHETAQLRSKHQCCAVTEVLNSELT